MITDIFEIKLYDFFTYYIYNIIPLFILHINV